jgi:hypothetical protein
MARLSALCSLLLALLSYGSAESCKTVAALVTATPKLSTLLAAVKAAKLTSALSDPNGTTWPTM